jgi:hypothetical protein
VPAEASSPADPASEKIGPAKLALSQVDNLADAFTAIPDPRKSNARKISIAAGHAEGFGMTVMVYPTLVEAGC